MLLEGMFPYVPAAASTRLALMCQCQSAAAGSLQAYLTVLQPHMQLRHNA